LLNTYGTLCTYMFRLNWLQNEWMCVCVWPNEMLICYHLGFIGETSRVGPILSGARITGAPCKGLPLTFFIIQVILVNVRIRDVHIYEIYLRGGKTISYEIYVRGRKIISYEIYPRGENMISSEIHLQSGRKMI